MVIKRTKDENLFLAGPWDLDLPHLSDSIRDKEIGHLATLQVELARGRVSVDFTEEQTKKILQGEDIHINEREKREKSMGMLILGFIVGLIVGYIMIGFLSGNFERYDVIEEAAIEGDPVCQRYMNERYGDNYQVSKE